MTIDWGLGSLQELGSLLRMTPVFSSPLPSRRREPCGNASQGNRAAAGEPTGRRSASGDSWQQSSVAAWQFLLRGLSEICYPPTCVLCHGPWENASAAGGDCGVGSEPAARTLCGDCRATLLATAAKFACDRCSRPQPPLTPSPSTALPDKATSDMAAADTATPNTAAADTAAAQRLCSTCRKRRGGSRRSEIRRSVAVGMYRDVMREAVVAAKRLSFQPLTLALGELLGQRVREAWGEVPIGAVTFVPSHWMRRWGRGGCPAQLLAHQVGRTIGVPVVPLLRSCRSTAKQGTLGDAERRTNVCGAFKVKKGYALLAPRVLVVDDVWTTGATLEEAARVIRHGYDVEIFAAVLARAIGTHDA